MTISTWSCILYKMLSVCTTLSRAFLCFCPSSDSNRAGQNKRPFSTLSDRKNKRTFPSPAARLTSETKKLILYPRSASAWSVILDGAHRHSPHQPTGPSAGPAEAKLAQRSSGTIQGICYPAEYRDRSGTVVRSASPIARHPMITVRL